MGLEKKSAKNSQLYVPTMWLHYGSLYVATIECCHLQTTNWPHKYLISGSDRSRA